MQMIIEIGMRSDEPPSAYKDPSGPRPWKMSCFVDASDAVARSSSWARWYR